MLNRMFTLFVTTLSLSIVLCLVAPSALAFKYRKATEGSAVVLRKMYPKKNKFELDADAGVIMNSSYVDTFLLRGGGHFFFKEVWGVGAEFTMAMPSDKNERQCIEQFYNDPDDDIGGECGGVDPEFNERTNWGPAYAPIREINSMITGHLIWNPIYGKQLFMLSAVSYFDVFVIMGGGMAMSTYYPLQTELTNGNPARGTYPKEESDGNPDNIGTQDESLIGIDGRPEAESNSNIVMEFGVGMKYHFLKRFNFKMELRNYTLLMTQAGFDNFFTLMGGFGVRL